jgi:transposase
MTDFSGLFSAMKIFSELSDVQWLRVVQLLPESWPRTDARGRPTVSLRSALNGVLWVLISEEPWASVPARYPVCQTCHRYFMNWYRRGVLLRVLRELFGSEGLTIYHRAEARLRVTAGHQSRAAGKRAVSI